MSAVLPFDSLGRKQLQVQLAHQFCRLKRVIGSLVTQVVASQAAQVLVGSRHQLLACFLVSSSPIREQSGQFEAIVGHQRRAGPLSKSRLRGLPASFCRSVTATSSPTMSNVTSSIHTAPVPDSRIPNATAVALASTSRTIACCVQP